AAFWLCWEILCQQPGLGALWWDAWTHHDLPLLQGLSLLFCTLWLAPLLLWTLLAIWYPQPHPENRPLPAKENKFNVIFALLWLSVGFGTILLHSPAFKLQEIATIAALASSLLGWGLVRIWPQSFKFQRGIEIFLVFPPLLALMLLGSPPEFLTPPFLLFWIALLGFPYAYAKAKFHPTFWILGLSQYALAMSWILLWNLWTAPKNPGAHYGDLWPCIASAFLAWVAGQTQVPKGDE
ncbi:MAG TPA: hypothetical protein VLM37_05920, partial [Fibrobacteraceae bacterium]|nr:hypothetical protein [Fibrobacteraceae bacterium]